MTRRRCPVPALVALLILAALPGAGPAAAAEGATGETAAARRDRVVAYWTEARIRAATPRDFVRSVDGTLRPLAKPGGATGSVTGASWPDGQGLVYRATGKVFFDMGGDPYVCSGSVVTDTRTDRSLVLSAAHCAYDEAADVWAEAWLFIPQYDSAPTGDCARNAYGCWTAAGLVVHDGYASREAFDNEATYHDFAFAVMDPGGRPGQARQLDATVGSFPIAFDLQHVVGTRLAAFGYPAAGKYRGTDLTWCAGPMFLDPYNAQQTYGLDCSMTGGASGGPWFSGFSEATGTGTVTSLSSYVWSGVRAMHGPRFNAATAEVYVRADTTDGSSIVP